MLFHLFKIIWNRKKANALLVAEIALAFLILCGLTTTVIYCSRLYFQPLGYEYENVWRVQLDFGSGRMIGGEDNWTDTVSREYDQLVKGIREMPTVEAVSYIHTPPYSGMTWNVTDTINGKGYLPIIVWSGDDLPQAMGLKITRGRWFGREDNGQAYIPVVITEGIARDIFGGEDPIGKIVLNDNFLKDLPKKIVGVISAFRKDGELDVIDHAIMLRSNPYVPSQTAGVQDSIPLASKLASVPRYLMVRMKPGATADDEEQLVKRMEALNKDWKFTVQHVENLRTNYLKERVTPLIALGIIAGFLLLMVALGLVGVVWQNVVTRTREIGLRRAVGANYLHVQSQILGELLVLATFSLLIGSVFFVQFPIMEVIRGYTLTDYGTGFAAATVIIYLITLACGFYPSRLAAAVPPTEALHYE